jgi:hypothetical protein
MRTESFTDRPLGMAGPGATPTRDLTGVRRRLERVRQRSQLLRRQWLRLWLSPRGRSRPAFVVGCGRSGTSMILWQLGRSWAVDIFNEDHPAAFTDFRLRPPPTIARLVQESPAPVTLFKPILNTSQTGHLLNAFPQARFLFVYRHFGDVIRSSMKRFGVRNRWNHVHRWMEDGFAELSFAPPPQATQEFVRARWDRECGPETGAALYWLMYNRLYFDMELDREPRVLLVRYESLVEHPEDQFRRVADFLGLPFEPILARGVHAQAVASQTPDGIAKAVLSDCRDLLSKLDAAAVAG